jgi:hypothetical protein
MTRLCLVVPFLLSACSLEHGGSDQRSGALRALDSVRISLEDSLLPQRLIDPHTPAVIFVVPSVASAGALPSPEEIQATRLIRSARPLADSLGISLYLRDHVIGFRDPSRVIIPAELLSPTAILFVAPSEPLRTRACFPSVDTLMLMLREWRRLPAPQRQS